MPQEGSDRKRPIFRKDWEARWKNNNIVLPDNLDLLPCSRCLGCKAKHAREWGNRCMNEASLYRSNLFVTFTYAPKYLPKYSQLNKRDMQLFWKRLREQFPGRRIRYYMCGEYGPKFKRPHYHACVFNLELDDLTYWKTKNKNDYYRSERLEKIWGKGMVVIGKVTHESAAYVARYSLKKRHGEQAHKHYTVYDKENGRVVRYQTEYSQASTGRGIGFEWYQKYKTDLYPSDQYVMNGFVGKPPRYYDRLLEAENPEMYALVKAKRKEVISKKASTLEYRHLKAKERVTRQRMQRLVRMLETEMEH
jgi:hypothetical protein